MWIDYSITVKVHISMEEYLRGGFPPRSGVTTIRLNPMQEGRTDGDSFPDNESDEAGRGRLEETEDIDRLLKTND